MSSLAQIQHHRLFGLGIVALCVGLLPLLMPNSYYYDIAITCGFNAILAIGLNLLIGYAGQISLGHAGFFALGAYASALLTSLWGWPPVLALVMAAAGVGLLAFIVARPILRLKGHYLAMATLGIGIIISIVLNTESWLTGGPDGLTVTASFGIGPWQLVNEKQWYWLVGGLLLLSVWLCLNLVDSPLGRALRALHGSEVGASVVGVDTTGAKVMVFVLSAVFASVVGSLYAHYSGIITPSKAGFFKSIEIVTMVVFGGMASTYGALFGAVFLTALPQVLTSFDDYEAIILGAIMMGTMIFLPKGLIPTLGGLIKSRSPVAQPVAEPHPPAPQDLSQGVAP